MRTLPRGAGEPKPADVHPYIDRMQAWLAEPASPRDVARLRADCGHVHVDNRPAAFDKSYRQRVDLKQPGPSALRWLADRDALVNRVELALDFIFPDLREQDNAYDFLYRCLVRRRHGMKQKVLVHPGGAMTRYDAGRWAPNATVLYRETHSRVTGELFCTHLEWRLNRLRAVRAAGIHAARDLLDFDHRGFWRKRLLLLEVDEKRLGRLARNAACGTKRQKFEPLDARYGRTLLNCAFTDDGIVIQNLIDEFRSTLRLEHALQRLDTTPWLPPAGR